MYEDLIGPRVCWHVIKGTRTLVVVLTVAVDNMENLFRRLIPFDFHFQSSKVK
jgi:hypothetical protein